MSEPEMKDIIIKAKQGDNEAFGLIYKEYLTPIYRYIFFRVGDKSQTDDLTQEVFLKVFKSLERLEVTDKSPLTYFYTVARNLLVDSYRKKIIPTIDEDDAVYKLIEEDNPEKQKILADDIKKLTTALGQISEVEADAIVMKFIDNYSNKEISQIMGKSEESVRQLQSRGLKSLRKFIKVEDFF